MGLDQRLLQMIGPGAADLDEPGLELGLIDIGDGAGRGVDDDMEARQLVVRHLGIEGAELAVIGLGQDLLDAQAELGGETVARQIDQAGDEALEGIAPDEEGDALALLQMQDAERRLEELVRATSGTARRAGKPSRMWSSALPSWLAGSKPARVDAGLDLAPEQRDLARAAAIGRRR